MGEIALHKSWYGATWLPGERRPEDTETV